MQFVSTVMQLTHMLLKDPVSLFGVIHVVSMGQQRTRVQGRSKPVENDEGASELS